VIHKTKGIVIRSVKYGETSLVASVYTELFGLQQYLVNGVRTTKKNSGISANQLQVGNILDMIVYQNDKNTLQRIKECKQAVHYQSLFVDVKKNSIMLFMIEVLQKCIRQPDAHPDMFFFIEDMLNGLDGSTTKQYIHIPIFFLLNLSHFFGFKILDNYDIQNEILDLNEGRYINSLPVHQHALLTPHSISISQYLKVMQFSDLEQINFNRQHRIELLNACINYYELHVQPFGVIRSLLVIRAVLEE
jgi:DNA repair protein RecO (recombination protein O)